MDWHSILPQLNLSGMALPLAQHCLLDSVTPERVILLLDASGATLQSARAEAHLREALSRYFGRELQLQIKLSAALHAETPEQRSVRETGEKQAVAEAAIHHDPVVKQLQETFGAVIVPGSIRPR